MNIERATRRAVMLLLLAGVSVLVPHPVLAQQTNSGFSQEVVSNQTTINIGAEILDQQSGQPRNIQLPPGTMRLVMSTNLQTPIAQWAAVGNTNGITNSTFSVPFQNVGSRFFRIFAQPDTNFDQSAFPPYKVVAVPPAPILNKAVMLGWTNRSAQARMDMLLVSDGLGHFYDLLAMMTPPGAYQSYSFDFLGTNGLQFLRYSIPAVTGDYFFLPATNFVNPDLVTVPYIIIPDPSRSAIMQIAAYDMTDPSNPQLLAEITGNGSTNGTLEIPGMVIVPGNWILEFQVTDVSFNTTITDYSITVAASFGMVYPMVDLENDGSNRICAATAGDGISIQATTTATNGTWTITQFDGPSGVQLQQVQVPVASTGGTLMYDDGGEPAGGYTNEWFYYTISIVPASGSVQHRNASSNPPNIPPGNRLKFWLTHPRQPAGEITAYDATVLPTDSGDPSFALSVLQSGVATMFSYTCYPVDFPLGVWQGNYSGNVPITTVTQPFAWTALQASLAGSEYDAGFGTNSALQIPTLPINEFFILGESGTNGAGVGLQVQGQDSYPDDILSQESLENFGFNKTNGLALAVFAACSIGDGPLMKFVLRNNGVGGQISPTTRQNQHIRWCFGLGWNQPKSQDWQIFDFISWWTFEAAAYNYSFDYAVSQAQYNTGGNGGIGAVWSGCQAMTISKTMP